MNCKQKIVLFTCIFYGSIAATQGTDYPNLDCSTSFHKDPEIALTINAVEGDELLLEAKVWQTNMQDDYIKTNPIYTLYFNHILSSSKLTINTLGKGTKAEIIRTGSANETKHSYFSTVFNYDDKVCSFHENQWPPIQTKSMRGYIFQHCFSTFVEEDSLKRQLNNEYVIDNATKFIAAPMVPSSNFHILNSFPVWKYLYNGIMSKVEDLLNTLSNSKDILLLTGSEDILTLNRTEIFLSGDWDGRIDQQKNFTRIPVPRFIWKGLLSLVPSEANYCAAVIIITNCIGNDCTPLSQPDNCDLQNCMEYFGNFLQIGEGREDKSVQYCCGPLNIVEPWINTFADLPFQFNETKICDWTQDLN